MILKLQYPYRILGITFVIGRKIGFLFTNLQMFQFRENTGVTDSKKMTEWIEQNGNQQLVNEMLFAAAQAYCMMNKTKENFGKEKLLKAISMSSVEVQARLMKAWEDSTDKTVSTGKKKVKQ